MSSSGAASSPDAYSTRPGEAFDPLWLQTPATLNRTRLADLPGGVREWVGRLAFELLSLAALRQLPAEDAPTVFGRRLGHLIATLRRGAQLEPHASDWRRAYLQHWSTVQEVWLGGGAAAGLGEGLVRSANAEARRLGTERVEVKLAPHAAVLPLIGAARSNASATDTAVVLDFGHTAIKRGIAHYANLSLARLDVLEPLPAPTERERAPSAVAEAIDATLTGMRASGEVVASVASYVNRDLTLADSHSVYALLRPSGRLRLGHDGTLAACGLQPNVEAAAVIMLGTALGVGFVPPPPSLRPVSAGFEVCGWRTA